MQNWRNKRKRNIVTRVLAWMLVFALMMSFVGHDGIHGADVSANASETDAEENTGADENDETGNEGGCFRNR